LDLFKHKMPRHVLRAKLAKAPAHRDAVKPSHSQSGYTKVNLVSQHPYEGFNPPKFAAGTENRMYGVQEQVVSNTMANTHPVGDKSSNLRHMVQSTVGDAYNLAMSGVLAQTVGSSHQASVISGKLLGPVKTQPMRYGQVPFAGRKF
jgi:hypothetical protein